MEKIKKKLEKDIQREICEWLDYKKFFFWKHNAFPRFNTKTNRFHAYPKYTPKGLPDILVVFMGKLITFEVKVPDYWKYTDDQKLMKQKLLDNGASYHLVTSKEEVVTIMDHYVSCG